MSASALPCAVPSAVPPGLVAACRELAGRYRGTFSEETVLRTVYESYQLFIATSGRAADSSRVGDAGDSGSGSASGGDSVGAGAVTHALRFAADWLADAARGSESRGATDGGALPRVLFVCLHNAGRAQMAEALLRRRAGGRVSVRSAGPAAGRAVQPTVVAAMAELGIGISAEYPEPLLDDVVRAADVVVTMGCGDICPVYVGKRYYDWPLRGTTGRGIAAVRAERDQIDMYVERLLGEMTRRPPQPHSLGHPLGHSLSGGGLRVDRQYSRPGN